MYRYYVVDVGCSLISGRVGHQYERETINTIRNRNFQYLFSYNLYIYFSQLNKNKTTEK